jgi:hypothetical protein
MPRTFQPSEAKDTATDAKKLQSELNWILADLVRAPRRVLGVAPCRADAIAWVLNPRRAVTPSRARALSEAIVVE